MQEIFNLNSLNIEKIVSELFDFSKVGAININGFIKEDFRKELVKEINNHSNYFSPSPSYYGKSKQNLSSLYIGPSDDNREDVDLPTLNYLIKNYEEIYKEISRVANFIPGKPNSIGYHKYFVGEIGITPHYDHSWFVNLVSVFVISGKGKFSIYKKRDSEEGSTEIQSLEGSLTLMRHPRNESENIFRPLHCIEKITEERVSAILRQDIRYNE